MVQNREYKINQLPAPTWNRLQVNETVLQWTGETGGCRIDTENLVVREDGAEAPAILTGAGAEADSLFEQAAVCRVSGQQENPVRIHIRGRKEEQSAGLVRITAEPENHLTVVMDCRTGSRQASLAVRTLVHAKERSHIKLIQILTPGQESVLLSDIGARCEEAAELELLQLFAGKGNLYDGCRVDLDGADSRFSTQIGYVCGEGQLLDLNMAVNHFGERSISDIRADGTLLNHADKIFRGTIDFKKGSAGAEGQETENVLLLGDDLRNRTVPLILCAEEDVKGNHGATIGELDEDTLLYFASRGIGKETAEKMMTRAKLERLCSQMRDAGAEQLAKEAVEELLFDGRADFPLLQTEKTFYLDNAATSQRPVCVMEAERAFYEHDNANPLRGFYPLSLRATEAYEEARKTVQRFLHAAAPEEIIFTRNTTESLNLVAYSYGLSRLKEGDEIVVSVMEHHSNLLPWQMVARTTGAKLVFLECGPDGEITEERMNAAFSDRTRLVAVTHVSNVLGRVNPIVRIAERAHVVGAVVVLDAAQSAPHMPLDVQALDVDFLAFSGHKLFGPMGIGVLYGRRKLLEQMPPFLTGGEMIDSVTREGAVFAELPHKFEAGTVNAAGAVGLAEAIRYIERIGFERMQERELTLTKRAMDGLRRLPHVHVLGSEDAREHTGIVTFVVDDVHPHDVSAILEEEGIDVRAGHHCAQPLLAYLGVRSATRASLMFYNTAEEVDAFVDAVASVRERMGYGE